MQNKPPKILITHKQRFTLSLAVWMSIYIEMAQRGESLKAVWKEYTERYGEGVADSLVNLAKTESDPKTATKKLMKEFRFLHKA